MPKFETLNDIMNSTDKTTQKLLRKILAIEDKFKHLQSLDSTTVKEIAEKIEKQIIQELT